MQQYLQQDPTAFGGGDVNLRRNVGNSPTNATDPSGLILFGIIPTNREEAAAFTGSLRDSFNSISNGLAGAYMTNAPTSMGGNTQAGQQLLSQAYNQGPLGQTENAPAAVRNTTRYALVVAAVAMSMAAGGGVGSFAGGIVSSAIGGAGGTLGGAVVGGAVGGAVGSATEQLLLSGSVNTQQVIEAAYIGGVLGGFGALFALIARMGPPPPRTQLALAGVGGGSAGGTPSLSAATSVSPAASLAGSEGAIGSLVGSQGGAVGTGASYMTNPQVPQGDNASNGAGNAPRTQFPANESQLRHIFREAEGHIADTTANRALLQGVADDAGALLGADRFGNQWFARLNADGTQTWVQVRNGTIINGGVNQTPRPFNPGTGLSGGGS